MKSLVLPIIAAALSSCIAGGIGQRHNPSTNYFKGDDYHISLVLSAPGGNAKRGFKSAQLVIEGLPPIDMAIEEATRERVIFTAAVGRSMIPTTPSSYHFTYTTAAPSGTRVFRPERAVTPSRSKLGDQ